MLTREQLDDLTQLHVVAERFGADVAIIGAAALQCFLEMERFTLDVDLVVALDLEAFAEFAAELTVREWKQEPNREHRWRAPRGSLIDLVPAGPKLRAAKQIVWPESQFAMSLVGFDHVFTQATPIVFAPDVQFKVAPPRVLALLKIISYLDEPYRRQKDLEDLQLLLRRYEAASDRIYGDEIFAADLEDIEFANAYLLGADLSRIATEADGDLVRAFLNKQQIPDEEIAELDREDVRQRQVLRFQLQLKAFAKGFIRLAQD
jgi:predicted nucleotidyltransferase